MMMKAKVRWRGCYSGEDYPQMQHYDDDDDGEHR